MPTCFYVMRVRLLSTLHSAAADVEERNDLSERSTACQVGHFGHSASTLCMVTVAAAPMIPGNGGVGAQHGFQTEVES